MWFVSATWCASLLPGISQWRPVLPTRQSHARHHDALARTESLLPNPLQTEAIRSDNSAVLVLASPGTGKTRVLRARMAYLLISKGVPSDRILTVAFSQHAVSQLRTRVGALTDTKGMWLGTFHSICARMVRQHHELLDLPRGFAVLPEGEQRKIVRQLVALEQSRTPYALSASTVGAGSGGYEREAAVLQQILLWKEKGLRPAEVPDPQDGSLVALARAVYPEYQRALRARDALDYPDLTLGALRLFQRQPQVLRAYRAQFDHILCDELQDTSANPNPNPNPNPNFNPNPNPNPNLTLTLTRCQAGGPAAQYAHAAAYAAG